MHRLLAVWRVLFPTLSILVLMGSPACSGGGDHGSSAAVSFAGQWQGTWNASSPASPGTMTLQLSQDGTSVTGTATFAGHPCLATCTVSCQVDGHQMSGWFDAGGFQMTFSGYCPESSHCSGPHHANRLTASYAIRDGSCTGESGVMHLTPVAALGIDVPERRAVQVGEVMLIAPDDPDVVRVPVLVLPERAR